MALGSAMAYRYVDIKSITNVSCRVNVNRATIYLSPEQLKTLALLKMKRIKKGLTIFQYYFFSKPDGGQKRENIFRPWGPSVETLSKKMTPPENNSQERGLPESKTDGKGLFVRQRAVIRLIFPF
jgi:hypothetical protein